MATQGSSKTTGAGTFCNGKELPLVSPTNRMASQKNVKKYQKKVSLTTMLLPRCLSKLHHDRRWRHCTNGHHAQPWSGWGKPNDLDNMVLPMVQINCRICTSGGNAMVMGDFNCSTLHHALETRFGTFLMSIRYNNICSLIWTSPLKATSADYCTDLLSWMADLTTTNWCVLVVGASHVEPAVAKL